MRAYVHRDIRAALYSVTVGGRVVEKPEWVHLTSVEFRVRAGGRARVLKEKRKNVHAFIVGEVTTTEQDEIPGRTRDSVKVKYDPYVAGDFFVAETGEVVRSAREVWMTPDGVYARL